MASSRDYLSFVLDQLSELDGVIAKPMMGEYLLYYQGILVGGVYDDRFLIKPTASAKRLLPNAPMESPYEGASELLLVDEIDDRALLNELLPAVAAELPAKRRPAKRKTDGQA